MTSVKCFVTVALEIKSDGEGTGLVIHPATDEVILSLSKDLHTVLHPVPFLGRIWPAGAIIPGKFLGNSSPIGRGFLLGLCINKGERK